MDHTNFQLMATFQTRLYRQVLGPHLGHHMVELGLSVPLATTRRVIYMSHLNPTCTKTATSQISQLYFLSIQPGRKHQKKLLRSNALDSFENVEIISSHRRIIFRSSRQNIAGSLAQRKLDARSIGHRSNIREARNKQVGRFTKTDIAGFLAQQVKTTALYFKKIFGLVIHSQNQNSINS